MGVPNASVAERKAALRSAMRAARKALDDRPARSAAIVEQLLRLDVLASASWVMAYDAIVGEVELATLIDALRHRGATVVVPADDPDPTMPDVVLVPGVAFTPTGDRLGQGGGWYDRFLPRCRDDAALIGVAFDVQLVDAVPVEDHDRAMDAVITEEGPHWRHG